MSSVYTLFPQQREDGEVKNFGCSELKECCFLQPKRYYAMPSEVIYAS